LAQVWLKTYAVEGWPRGQHTSDFALVAGKAEFQAAAMQSGHSTNRGPRRRRTMTVDSLQRMVNDQLVNDMFRDLSHNPSGMARQTSGMARQTSGMSRQISGMSRQISDASNPCSFKTGFDSVVCSPLHSQVNISQPTNNNNVLASASKPQECKGVWPFKLLKFRKMNKVQPSTSEIP